MSIKIKIKSFFYKLKTNKNYQLGIVACLLIFGAAFVWVSVWYSLSQKVSDITVISTNINKKKNVNSNTEVSTKVPRKIDGTLVDPGLENLSPIAVMIENLASSEVRPQFGLNKAQIVYEMIVEGGITRFMAVFASNETISQIGPVRSARPTYLEFSSEFDALYVHAGGSPEALGAISGLGIKDCSALNNDSRFFWRDETRFAPHNLFTSSELLAYAVRDKSLDFGNYVSWQYDEDNIKKKTDKPNIRIDFSKPEYEVKWEYHSKTNDYSRSNGGAEHKDALTNEVLNAKNIIIQIVPEAIPAGEDGRVNFDVNGEGNAFIFHDGSVINGVWKKNGRTDRTKYFDVDGNEIILNRGRTWIEILPQNQTWESY